MIVAGYVSWWLEAPAPAPRTPAPAPARREIQPQVLATLTLAGTPRREVRLERGGGERQARIDGRVWSLGGLGSMQFVGTSVYPGRPGIDLLHFGWRHDSLRRDQWLGVTRDGRLVVVREEMGSQLGRVSSPDCDGVFLQGQSARPPATTPAEWVALLHSDDPLTVLDALGWLSLSSARSQRSLSLDAAAPEIVARANAAQEVAAAVTALRLSTDHWIREAADRTELVRGH